MNSHTTMRNVLLGLTVFAAGCSGETPTSPTTSSANIDRCQHERLNAGREQRFTLQ